MPKAHRYGLKQPPRCPTCMEHMRKEFRKPNYFWCCEGCKARHMCDAYGNLRVTPANKKVRGMRMAMHRETDKLWIEHGTKWRSRMYTFLAEKLGVPEFHFGRADMHTLIEVKRITKGMTHEDLRDWYANKHQ